MKTENRADVEEMIGAVSRLCLWLVGELEPDNSSVVELDLNQLERLLVHCEVKFAKTFPKTS